MPETIATNVVRDIPASIIEAPDGAVYVFNGLRRPWRWDGIMSTAEPAGILEPANQPGSLNDSGSGAISGNYTYAYRYVDKRGIPSSLSPLRSGNASSASSVSFSVSASPEPRVVLIEGYRSLADAPATLYLHGTRSNTPGSISSSDDDDTLATKTALPILLADGSLNANRFTPPPNMKRVVKHSQDRMFFFVNGQYSRGHAELTSGSTAVTIIGGKLDASFEGRQFNSPLIGTSYTIERVASSTSLRISEPYGATSELYAPYTIDVPETEQGAFYWSEPGEPESVPSINQLTIQEDGDEDSGIITVGSFIYLAKQHHLYRFSFGADPVVDGGIFLQCERGLVNNRCHVVVEGNAYCLDREGVWRLSGGAAEPLSEPIQDIVRDKINWNASKWFFAAHDPGRGIIRFFVAMEGNYHPKHALCFNYRLQFWWVEQWELELGASCLTEIRSRMQQVAGGQGSRFFVLDDAATEVTQGRGTLRGNPTGSTVLTITDTNVQFPADVVDAPVSIVAGRGRGQTRRIVQRVSDSELRVDRPWVVQPDSESTYQVGGIPWRWVSGRMPLVDYPNTNSRQIKLHLEPTKKPGRIDLSEVKGYGAEPTVRHADYHPGGGIRVEEPGATSVAIQTTSPVGVAYWNEDGAGVDRVADDEFVTYRLDGVRNEDPVRINRMRFTGVENPARR